MLVFQIIGTCGIANQNLRRYGRSLRPREKTKRETDPGDVPNSVVQAREQIENPFSISLGQTDRH